MRVLHLTNSDFGGGAAIAVLRLHHALMEQNVESQILVARKRTHHSGVIQLSWMNGGGVFNRIKSRLAQCLIGWARRRPDSTYRSISIFPSGIDSLVNAMNEIDIVHIHWIQGEMMSIEEIGNIDKPVVFTLHDSWLFCGSEHHPVGIDENRYSIKGFSCKRTGIRANPLDIDGWCWERKVKAMGSKRCVIAPSRWMSERAASSYILRSARIEVVPNIVDNQIYYPSSMIEAQARLGIEPSDDYVLYTGAYISSTSGKGLELLVALQEQVRLKRGRVRFLVVGGIDDDTKRILKAKNIAFVGRRVDSSEMPSVYAAAKLVCQLSRFESFGLVAAEAQACGKPVVALDNGGIRDILIDGINGYICDSLGEMSSRIVQLLGAEEDYKRMSNEAVRRAKQRWSPRIVARRTIQVYVDALRNH